MFLPISINERINFIKSIGPLSLSDEIIKKLANNRNIYYSCNSRVCSLLYIKDNKGITISHLCKVYNYDININQPFIIYEVYETYLRGFFVDDYMNEINYKEYIMKYGYHRGKLISEILDNE
jgi:hypothetical protein